MRELCAHLGHAANGWPATVDVRRTDGGTLAVCDMCAAALEQADGPRLTINCRDRLVWVATPAADLLASSAEPQTSTRDQRVGASGRGPVGEATAVSVLRPAAGGPGRGPYAVPSAPALPTSGPASPW